MTGFDERLEAMKMLRFALGFVVAMGLCGVGFAQGAAAGCVKRQQTYTCNWDGFRAAMVGAATVAVRSEQLDPYTGVQLKELAKALGKNVVAKDADLGFEVVPVDSNGVRVGPGDEAIAELRIYAKAPMTERYEPIWVETYVGEVDRPWASSVHSVIEQFRGRLAKR
jgi:hypothetical protein